MPQTVDWRVKEFNSKGLPFWESIQIHKDKDSVHKVYAINKRAGKIPWWRKSQCFHLKGANVSPAIREGEDVVTASSRRDLVLHPWHSTATGGDLIETWDRFRSISQWGQASREALCFNKVQQPVSEVCQQRGHTPVWVSLRPKGQKTSHTSPFLQEGCRSSRKRDNGEGTLRPQGEDAITGSGLNDTDWSSQLDTWPLRTTYATD